MRGPLAGVRVVELAGLAPAPFAGMLLADFGADVTRVDRVGAPPAEVRLGRGKRSVALDVKKEAGAAVLARMAGAADVLIEPFRPGVMEKLGLGPDVLCKANPRLIYARITGYGQTGSRSQAAGHDINYVALSGALPALGRFAGGGPQPPLNLLADFAGGGLMCAFGVLAALHQRSSTGKGQVVDASMTEGAAYVSSFLWATRDSGLVWPSPGSPGANLLDGGYPLYQVYETSDGGHVAVGALEPQFAQQFFQRLGGEPSMEAVLGGAWPEGKALLAKRFKEKSRAQWEAVFRGSDACVTPVLSKEEAASEAAASGRPAFAADGSPLAAPRLSAHSPGPCADDDSAPGAHTRAVLSELGFTKERVEELLGDGVVGEPAKAKL